MGQKTIDAIEAVAERFERARKIVADGRVHHDKSTSAPFQSFWFVEAANEGKFYRVWPDSTEAHERCTCKDAIRAPLHGGYCKHVLAVMLEQRAEERWAEVKDESRKAPTQSGEESPVVAVQSSAGA